MSAARLCILVLLVPVVVDAVQHEQSWTTSGTRAGITLAFRDDSQLDARQVPAIVELPHTPDQIVAVVCDFTQTLDPPTNWPRRASPVAPR